MNLAKIYNKQFVLARSTIRALVASKIWLFFLAIAPPLCYKRQWHSSRRLQLSAPSRIQAGPLFRELQLSH